MALILQYPDTSAVQGMYFPDLYSIPQTPSPESPLLSPSPESYGSSPSPSHESKRLSPSTSYFKKPKEKRKPYTYIYMYVKVESYVKKILDIWASISSLLLTKDLFPKSAWFY